MADDKIQFIGGNHEQFPDAPEQKRIRELYGLELVQADPENPLASGLHLVTKDPHLVAVVTHVGKGDYTHLARIRSARPDIFLAVQSDSLSQEQRNLAEQAGADFCFDQGESMETFYQQVAEKLRVQQLLDDDYTWATTDPEVQKQYGGQVVAVFNRQIIARGNSYQKAWQAAQEQSKVPLDDLTFAPVPLLIADADTGFPWCLSDTSIQEQFGGLVAAIADQKVWGAGHDREKALQAARQHPDCPEPERLFYVLIPNVLCGD